MLNIFIKTLRIPIALVAILIAVALLIIGFLIEIPILILSLIFLSISSTKSEIEKSWISFFPNSTRCTYAILLNIIIWAWHIDNPQYYQVIEHVYGCENCERAQSILLIIAAAIEFLLLVKLGSYLFEKEVISGTQVFSMLLIIIGGCMWAYCSIWNCDDKDKS